MKSNLLSALLLFSLGWECFTEHQTVEVEPGEEVTLQCANISKTPTVTFWSRFINRTEISCISSTYGSGGDASPCAGFDNGKFEMSSNVSTVSLKIKWVSLSDSGIYLCGFYLDRKIVINVRHLKVQGGNESHSAIDSECKKIPDGIISVILGGLTVFLIMVIIGLVVKIRQLQTEPSPSKQNLDSEDLNYAALRILPKPQRKRRPAPKTELEADVVYAATR